MGISVEFRRQLGWAWSGFQDIFAHMPGALEQSRKVDHLFLSLSLCKVITSPHDITYKISELLPCWIRNLGSCGTGYKAFHGFALEVQECYPIIMYLSSRYFEQIQNQGKKSSTPSLRGGTMKYLCSCVIYHTAFKHSVFPLSHTYLFPSLLSSLSICITCILFNNLCLFFQPIPSSFPWISFCPEFYLWSLFIYPFISLFWHSPPTCKLSFHHPNQCHFWHGVHFWPDYSSFYCIFLFGWLTETMLAQHVQYRKLINLVPSQSVCSYRIWIACN